VIPHEGEDLGGSEDFVPPSSDGNRGRRRGMGEGTLEVEFEKMTFIHGRVGVGRLGEGSQGEDGNQCGSELDLHRVILCFRSLKARQKHEEKYSEMNVWKRALQRTYTKHVAGGGYDD